jgi:choline dehydrogenase-like flavoprotein
MRTEVCDVAVIGSGAGGSVVAYHAARRGLRTLVLERGPYVRPEQMSTREVEMVPWLYKDGGLQMNTSMDMFIMQGVCVGGSTVLSNMVLLRAPDHVFATWRNLGAAVHDADMHAAYEEVEQALCAGPPPAETVSRTSHAFMRGARALGLDARWMTKSIGACRGCGNCNIGCTFGTKRDASTTYIRWAEEAGARVLADTEVERLVHRRGHVEVLECRTGRRRQSLRVVARQVVLAAGAIGSSALLLRSGVRKNVGTRVSFNAGSMIIAEFPEILDSWDADQMSSYLEGDGYCIEATHNPIMSTALTTPGWLRQHGELMRRHRRLAYAGALVATEPVGRVVQSPFWGHEETRYRPTERDLETLKRGLRTIAEVFFAAGAERIVLPTHRQRTIESAAELDLVASSFRKASEICFGTAHPHGGNPMSDDPMLGAVRSDFGVHGFDNLYVVDASVMPTCTGVNPIDTIMALATLASRGIVARA